jgi:hypothetical protein
VIFLCGDRLEEDDRMPAARPEFARLSEAEIWTRARRRRLACRGGSRLSDRGIHEAIEGSLMAPPEGFAADVQAV